MHNSDDLINTFISESHELLDDTEARLNVLENNYDFEIINTVFRMFHSIKGSAGYLNFGNIKDVTHEAENLLSLYRDKQIGPTQKEVDLLYQTCDFIRQLIINIDGSLTDTGFENEARIIINSIKESAQNINPERKYVEPGCESNLTNGLSENKSLPVNMELVTPEMVEKFLSESNDFIDECEIFILGLEKNPEERELVSDIFRRIHSIKGNAGFLGFDKVEKDCIELEFFLDGMRADNAVINQNVINFILKQIDKLRNNLNSSTKTANDHYSEEAIKKDKKIGEIFIDMGEVKEDDLKNALKTKNKFVGKALVEDGKIDNKTLKKALKKQDKLREEIGINASLFNRKDIRVSTEKLDQLFELMGELITAQAMVLYNPEVSGIISEGFTRTKNYLEKITKELHEITLSVRMIPLEGLFNKMNRLVRDLSRKSDKQVQLHISGADAEMDRTVIEQIADPLIHIIRNAIDHGLENAEERIKINKKETGNLYLAAKYVGSEVWISIRDDGRGLNREKILKKAKENGLIKEPSEALSDKKVWQIIFHPGFSTAEKVTNISGRGVGMDVVNKNIQKLNGITEIKSQSGKGTEIILKIPLTMAIVDAVITEVGNSLYAIPSLEIFEFFKADNNQIKEAGDGNYFVNLRDEIIPLIRLNKVFNNYSTVKNFSDGIIVVLKKEEKKLCIRIDRIYKSQQIVVKSLSDSIGKSRGISGCSILANGDVALILDVKEVIDICIE